MDDNCKPIRGRRIELRTQKSACAQDLLLAACSKFAAQNKHFAAEAEWTLRYPDGTEVVTLPESGEPFSLHKYKRLLSKDYQRIALFISQGKRLAVRRLSLNII